MFEAILQKYQTKEEVPTKVLLKQTTNLNNYSPSGSLPWQNERVEFQVNLQYSTKMDAFQRTCLTICVKYNKR